MPATRQQQGTLAHSCSIRPRPWYAHTKPLNLLSPRGFFQAHNAPKPVFARGSALDPAGGAYNAPPHPLVGWGGGHRLPIPLPFDAFGVSISPPSSLSSKRNLRQWLSVSPDISHSAAQSGFCLNVYLHIKR